mmetsp:Transcript_17739/g.22058  ORF Transcript_17739/g.22058 Transcript_17739/m.22058 type:complete len:647 (-) Transcript_17739:201-2141(-)
MVKTMTPSRFQSQSLTRSNTTTRTAPKYDHDTSLPRMTREEIIRVAIENDGYETPELNSSLYLHYKGYRRMENLEPYVNLKALWLDSNGFETVENLHHLTQLRCLFLQRNLLSKVSSCHFEGLTSLVQLDLSENRITVIDSLSSLPNLATLNLSKNVLRSSRSIVNLQSVRKLAVLDLSHNLLDGEDIISTFAGMNALTALNVVGNPVVSGTAHFRKKCVAAMPTLRYLDRPVFDDERAACEAWLRGGREEELRVKEELKAKRWEKEKRGMEDFRRWQHQIREKRKEELKIIQEKGMNEQQLIEKKRMDDMQRDREQRAKEEAIRERRKYAIPITQQLIHNKNNETPTPYEEKPKRAGEQQNNSQNDDNVHEHANTNSTQKAMSTLHEIHLSSQNSTDSSKTTEAQNVEVPKTITKVNFGKQTTPKPPEDDNDTINNRVQESLAIYRTKKQLKSVLSKQQRHEQKQPRKGTIFYEAVNAPPPPPLPSPANNNTNTTLRDCAPISVINWTKSMDHELTTSVHENVFDFNAVAQSLTSHNGFPPMMTGDDCRERWCHLDNAAEDVSHREGQQHYFVTPGNRLSLEELLARPSRLLRPPTEFPRVDDAGWNDDGDKDKIMTRDDLWIDISSQGLGLGNVVMPCNQRCTG